MRPAPGGLRFRPPPLARTAEIRWLLAAAFAPIERPRPAPVDGRDTAALAHTLGLEARIAARIGPVVLAAELGAEAAAALAAARRAGAAVELLYRGLAARIAELAAAEAMPLLALKGFAIALTGAAPDGGRPFADLDLLAPRARARDLQGALVAAGFRESGQGNEHHLGSLEAPQGGVVEVHYRLRGVRLGARRWATFDEVRAAGLERPAPGLPAAVARPARTLLAAHALVHGLDQHGLRPATYPALRWVGDLVDLLEGEAGWGELLERGGPWIEGTLRPAELAAAQRLCLALAGGELPGSEGPAGRLLDHLLAGRLDPGYRDSLPPRHALDRLRQAARDRRLIDHLARKLGWRRSPSV